MVMLLLLFGEVEFGVEHVLWTYEMTERCGEGIGHLEFSSISSDCLAVV